MTSFKNLESLQQHLKQDAKQVSLNPVRFINVDSMAMWVEVKKFLLSLVDRALPLSKYCEDMDTTPNLRRVSAELKTAEKSLLVSPLSELLRITPEQAESVILRFIKTDFQNNDTGRLRIYFLMYRMKSLLRTIPSDDPRTKDCIILFETDEESDYKLTIVQRELDVRLPGNEIDGFKSYLEYWEANPDKPLILHTGNAIHFEKNHFFDDVHVIVTSYDLIKYQCGLPGGIVEELGTNDNWNSLLKEIIREGSFDGACRSVLSINKYSSNLYERWNQYSPFQKWLLWLWTRQQSGKSYEIVAAKVCNSSEEFVDAVYGCIINYLHDDKFDQLYLDRKRILSSMRTVPSEHYWNQLSSLSRIDALSCLTCLTDVELKTIFEIIADYDYRQRNHVLPALKQVYPALFYYLQNDEHPNCDGLSEDHAKYFGEYKWLKATNSITEEFISKVKRIALEKGSSVFQMKSRNHYVTAHYDEHTSILFVDGMGAEYIDYLAYLFSDLDERQYSVVIEAGFCTLPSVTEINKDFMNGRNTVDPPVRELDELKHANNVHPESLIKQLLILDGLKNRVLGLLVGNTHRIIIAADHGTSRMAVKVRNTYYDNVYPKPDGASIYKYGRFCEGTEDEPNYPTAINYNDRLVFADYSRFIQTGAPIDEIHGGASLEEWIVPVITIEKLTGQRVEKVEITPKSKKYRPALGTRQVRIEFTINEKKESISVRVKGNTYKCECTDGIFSFVFVPAKDDTKLTVKVFDSVIIGEFDIEIEQGIKKNEGFDI